jgi:hypothetical protein
VVSERADDREQPVADLAGGFRGTVAPARNEMDRAIREAAGYYLPERP